MKYIPADKLIAEIESRMEDCKLPDGRFPTTTNIVRYEELSCFRNFISSLQQEQSELDLEKEIEKYYYDNFAFISSAHTPTKDIMSDIANHFYELGLNARK